MTKLIPIVRPMHMCIGEASMSTREVLLKVAEMDSQGCYVVLLKDNSYYGYQFGLETEDMQAAIKVIREHMKMEVAEQ